MGIKMKKEAANAEFGLSYSSSLAATHVGIANKFPVSKTICGNLKITPMAQFMIGVWKMIIIFSKMADIESLNYDPMLDYGELYVGGEYVQYQT